jgi:uncharacterized protein YjiS (DUF1127 family)
MTFITQTSARLTPARPRFSLARMVAVWRQRQQLRQLDEHALRDIGLRREEADREANRPLWDVPSHWQR